jgi:hypothetical protein
MVHFGIGWLYDYASYYLFGSGSSGLGKAKAWIPGFALFRTSPCPVYPASVVLAR